MSRVDLDSLGGPVLHELEHHGLRRLHINYGDRRGYCGLVSGERIFSPSGIHGGVFHFLPEVPIVLAALIHAELGVELLVFENLILLVETQVFVFFLCQILEIGSSPDFEKLVSDFILVGRYARSAVIISPVLLDRRDSARKIIMLHFRIQLGRNGCPLNLRRGIRRLN